MAFVQIRGSQIMPGTIGDSHIDANNPITEAKLSINWHQHTEALQDRKIVIPVQVNSISIPGGASIDVSSNLSGNLVASSTDKVEGIIADAPNNRVEIRNPDNSDVLVTVDGKKYQLYGRVTSSGSDQFTLSFYYQDDTGAEQSYTFPNQATPISVVAFFPKRQNLLTMDEMVLAGYRFLVQDAVDAVTGANVNQLAADLYGPNYSLTGNGVAKLQRSVVAEIQYQTSGVVNSTVRANTIIDEVVSARGAFQNLLGRLNDVDNRISAVTATANNAENEIVEARTNNAATPVTYASLKARLDAMDAAIDSVTNGGSTTQSEVSAARTTTVAQQAGAYINESDLASRLAADFSAVVAQIQAEQSRAEAAENNLQTNINNVQNALNTFESDLANSTYTDTAHGAYLVGLNSTHFTSKNVAAALDELFTKETADIASLNNALMTATHGATNTSVSASETIDEVVAARTNGAATPQIFSSLKARLDAADAALVSATHGTTNASVSASAIIDEVVAARGTFADLKVRLDEVDSRISANSNNIATLQAEADATKNEVVVARGTAASLDARLSVSINPDGTLKAGQQIHTHHKFVYQATGGETQVMLPEGQAFQYGDDSLDVYVNGMLQVRGVNYTELQPVTPNGTGIGISFGSTTLVAGDFVILKWYNNNAQ
jgi:chromosome segregation ATPase